MPDMTKTKNFESRAVQAELLDRVMRHTEANRFEKCLEKHPFHIEKTPKLANENTSSRELAEMASKLMDDINMKLEVAKLDKSKNKDLIWLREGIGRMVHDFNESGYAIILYRLEVPEKTVEKIRQMYGTSWDGKYMYSKTEKIHEERSGNGNGTFYVTYDHERKFMEISVQGYKKEYDIFATTKVRDTIEKIDKKVDLPKIDLNSLR